MFTGSFRIPCVCYLFNIQARSTQDYKSAEDYSYLDYSPLEGYNDLDCNQVELEDRYLVNSLDHRQ